MRQLSDFGHAPLTDSRTTRQELLKTCMSIIGGPRAIWPFAEASGSSIKDLSGNGFHLTSKQGLVTVAISAFAVPPAARGLVQAYSFNGTNEWLDGVDSDLFSFGATAFSVGAWIKNTTAPSAVIVAKNTDILATTQEWVFWQKDTTGELQLWLFDHAASGSIKTTAASALDTNWHFVVGTYGGGTSPSAIDLYVDGALVSSTDNTTGTYNTMQNGVVPISVGAIHDVAGGQDHFKGSLAMPFVSAGALTAAKVSTLYSTSRRLLGL